MAWDDALGGPRHVELGVLELAGELLDQALAERGDVGEVLGGQLERGRVAIDERGPAPEPRRQPGRGPDGDGQQDPLASGRHDLDLMCTFLDPSLRAQPPSVISVPLQRGVKVDRVP